MIHHVAFYGTFTSETGERLWPPVLWFNPGISVGGGKNRYNCADTQGTWLLVLWRLKIYTTSKTSKYKINKLNILKVNYCKPYTHRAKQPEALLQHRQLMINQLVWMYHIAHITRSMWVGEVSGDVSIPLAVWRGEDEEMEVGGTHCGW